MRRFFISKISLSFIAFVFLLSSCIEKNPNLNNNGKDEFKALEVEENINQELFNYDKEFYIPIYSDVYIDSQNPKHLLSATLSVRNTSYKDSIFIDKIDYFDTHGNLVKEFVDKTISLPPMATVNYVIEKEDDTGGSGANFIVHVSSKSERIKPLIQAVMIGQYSNKSFSFITDGYIIE